MTMRDELSRLAAELYQPAPPPTANDADPEQWASRITVALPAGGFGYRMRAVREEADAVTQKALLPLPNGETLIGRVIRQYAEAGFRHFVALVNYQGDAVEQHLEGGKPWGVRVDSSYDPEPTGSGRTRALAHAINQGLLDPANPVVIHNADCQIFNYSGSFPADLLRFHVGAVANLRALATVAAVDGMRYPYTGMSIAGNRATEVEMYPFIPIPGHTGITVLTPEALSNLLTNLEQSQKNFERDLFPHWSAAGRLAALVISHQSWIAVDDRKSYREFCRAVETEVRPV